MITVQGYEGASVGVLGLGRSGIATAKALRAGNARVLCWDDTLQARMNAKTMGLSLSDLSQPDVLDTLSALIVSPGIPHLYPQPHPVIATALARGVIIDNDISLFFQSIATGEWQNMDRPPRIIAVTGSNGKSTTTALIHHILQKSGRHSQMGGNIGRGVLSLDPPTNNGFIVLELSSYQIELARNLTPDIAVMVNLSPDHLDRHGGLGGYFAAKRRLFVEGGPERAIIGVDEIEGCFLASQIAQGAADNRIIRISVNRKLDGFGWSVFVKKGFLCEWRKGRQIASIDLRSILALAGVHNHQNACAAYGVMRSLGVAPKTIEAALHSFSGLSHRSQLIAQDHDIRYINDSKATNVESAMVALQAFPKIRWIAGGQGKEGGISKLIPHLKNVVKAYLIGSSANDFAQQLTNTPYEVCTTMKVAVEKAAAEAQAGEVVLLAPAAASFDQYSDFEKRGEDFIHCVSNVINRRQANNKDSYNESLE